MNMDAIFVFFNAAVSAAILSGVLLNVARLREEIIQRGFPFLTLGLAFAGSLIMPCFFRGAFTTYLQAIRARYRRQHELEPDILALTRTQENYWDDILHNWPDIGYL